MLRQQLTGPKDINTPFRILPQPFNRLFKNRDSPSLHAKNLKELIPKTLRLGALFRSIRPFLGKPCRSGPNLV